MVLAISGTIAAPKGIQLYNLLRVNMKVILLLSPTAKFFLPSVPKLSSDVIFDQDFYTKNDVIKHTTIAQQAKLFIAYPASANLIAHLSHGWADNLVTLVYLAANCPKIVQPAMNSVIFQSRSVQRNLAVLQADGVTVLNPAFGSLACGVAGIGRAWEPTAMYQYVCQLLKLKSI